MTENACVFQGLAVPQSRGPAVSWSRSLVVPQSRGPVGALPSHSQSFSVFPSQLRASQPFSTTPCNYTKKRAEARLFIDFYFSR